MAENSGRKTGAGLAAIALIRGSSMSKRLIALSAMLAVCLAVTAPGGHAAEPKAKAAAKTAATVKGKRCKTLVGEMVTFGEESTRDGASNALDREIKAWETRYSVKAKPQDRKMVCKDYIKMLNEFECKVTAVVCR
jgi:hypothetical protein